MDQAIADVAQGIRETGIYRNDAKQRFEAWAVAQDTGETRSLGFLVYEIAEDAYSTWSRDVWRCLLCAVMAGGQP